jgi:methyl-accepting chemotaxis protein
MSQHDLALRKRHGIALPGRIAIGLVCAAVLPLLIMLAFISFITRPALIDQTNKAMASDAETRVQLIDTYFNERLLDAQTLTQVPSVQTFVALPYNPLSPEYHDQAIHAQYALLAGIYRDKNYASWSLFDRTGQLRLFYPAQPQKHGTSFVRPQDMQKIMAGQTFITPVYYSPTTKKASVEIYSPIPDMQNPHKVQGFMQATLNLDYIWNKIVQKDLGVNGLGSYAFIVDENGVRIADTDPQQRFTSIHALDSSVQQQISQEARYGNNSPVKVIAAPNITQALSSHSDAAIFQAQPSEGQSEPFQVARQAATMVPWNYFVLSPISSVTDLAYKQQIYTTIIAFFASLLVAIVGAFAGRGISRPIMNAVEYLRNSSLALTTLAANQQEAASEQIWVVDSSQVGLQSVQYYTDANKLASRQLIETTQGLALNWQYANRQQVESAFERIIQAAHYIGSSSNYQDASNHKFSTALKVATQVTEQLHSGATSASEAATQLEQVVDELRTVVGR